MRLTSRLAAVVALLSGVSPFAAVPVAAQTGPVDREYRLEATILGYRGSGGDIDGLRNPVLTALTGQTVRITLVNTDPILHDIALEALKLRSTQIVDRGASTSITFVAKASDTYYCTIPGHRAAGMEGRLEVSEAPRPRPIGSQPEVAGQPLDLGFEDGTLSHWKAEGDAFGVLAGNVAATSQASARSGHDGGYWATSGAGGNSRMGTLTSDPFPVTAPYASFLVSGGAFASTRVEIALAGSDEVIFTISGTNHERLRPAVVDLSPYAGQSIVVRLVDNDTGAPTAVYIKESPWAHINFDNFRFHDQRPAFVDEVRPADTPTLPSMDHYQYAGLSGREAARVMTVPKGFSVRLAAAEPDVVRPIAFAMDDRARLWVAEARTYPDRAPEGEGGDRILILEDTDGDGTLDSRKVFIEQLNLVSGLEVGFGGVWVGAAPYLLFIPIGEGGDTPSGPPQILLDGWGYQDTHEMLNTFTWGPDGWLYGNHGVFTHSRVGKPGTPDAERVLLNGAVWRYHPTRHEFEVFAHGTSNPWGLDFNDYGHVFTTACVIEHLFHVVQGARYKRQAGKHFNPYTYDDIKTVADHLHWVGSQGPHAGNSRSDAAGGGHAHAGAMIYLGGDSWPAEYRDAIFMNNVHGQRANVDRLARAGSGYTASHGPDFLLTHDAWSQMLNLRYGPDGSVWAIDWYDKNQCHSDNPDVHDKTLGRIFKIVHDKDTWTRVDLAALPSARLVDLQLHRNDWYVRHARRLLQERGPDPVVHAALKRMLDTNPDVSRKLRALWALHATAGLTGDDLVALLDHDSEYVRSWAVQLLLEQRAPSTAALDAFARMARQDPSSLVRLYLASGLQRVPVDRRWDTLAGLLASRDDRTDQNLPLMVWYATEPVVERDMWRALEMTAESPLPNVFDYTVKRIAAVGTQEALRVLTDRLGRTRDRAQRKALADGIVAIVDTEGAAPPYEIHSFARRQLSDQFWSEGASAGDLNNDGVKDIISGPYWWEGPSFTTRHEYYPATATFTRTDAAGKTETVPGFEGFLGVENKYSDNFFVFTQDFNRDGWNDILVIGFPGTDTSWYENPKGADRHWTRHKVFEQTDNESATFTDITGDGKPELVCITKGQYGYATPDWDDPARPWTFHAISPNNKYGNFTHGLGVGDVDGDGRADLLEKDGWWQQPASLDGDPVWAFHPFAFGTGGAQMYAYDVNGDGRNDVITSLAAHGFGLAWFEQARDEAGDITFRPHVIINQSPDDSPYGVKFSEIHAIDLVDMDGDGLEDLVAGKRFWSHGRTGDPDRNDAAVLYWFRLTRSADGTVDYVPYLIDDASGVGTQVVATDIDGDGLPDIVVGNKRGTFVHLHQKQTVSQAEWEKAQPKRQGGR